LPVTSKIPVSVFIIAKNEADRISPPIESVIEWADEVIVIDSGSEDNTVDVSQSLGARVLYHEWQGYGLQKIYGESLCRNKWILNIDADETVSPELAEEIQEMFQGGKEPLLSAYHIPIKIVSRFETTARKFAPSNDPIRFYHKDYAGFKDSTVHDSVVITSGNKQEGWLKGIMLHRCFRSYSHAVQKINFYTSMQAEDMVQRGRTPSIARIIAEPFFAFLKAYTVRRYCLLGVDGFIESFIYAFSRTLRLAKARERNREIHIKK
jgi:glycosyltransferase involved in cell wall biosynthesis